MHVLAHVVLPPTRPRPPTQKTPLQRLAEVRRRKRLSRSEIGRRLGISVAKVKQQEQPGEDILLSDLFRWQEALDVPVEELLHEPPGELALPERLRGRLSRAMKTARSILERAQQLPIRRLATVLTDQLVELLPELQGVAPWPGAPRSSRRVEPLQWHLVYEREWK